MTERESTGIQKLDDMLEGGLPKGSTILLVGPPGSGKTVFCQQFLAEGLKNDQGSLFIALDNPPEEIKENAKGFGWNFEDKDNFIIMDVYSWKLGEELSGKYTVQGPSDLNQLNMTLSDALKELEDVQKRVVMDSASSLTFFTDINSTVRFLQVVSAKTKASGGVFLLTVEKGVHDEKDLSTLNYVADGVIEMKKEDGDRYISIPRMSKTTEVDEWTEYKITENGIKAE